MKRPYRAAKKFLLDHIPHEDPESILDAYLSHHFGGVTASSIPELFKRLIGSAQNANMKAGVIGGSIGGFAKLGMALYKFNPARVQKAFEDDPDALLEHIKATLRPQGKMRTTSRSIWPKYCKTILSAARFITQFKDGDDFLEWCNLLYSNERTMAALPLLIAIEIEGMGYALACDFLKELGFINYGKPDVHVIEILVGLGLCPPKASQYQAQKVIAQIAKAENVSAFDVDKVFWLIGSGKLHKHPEIGRKGQIGRMKAAFLAEFGA